MMEAINHQAHKAHRRHQTPSVGHAGFVTEPFARAHQSTPMREAINGNQTLTKVLRRQSHDELLVDEIRWQSDAIRRNQTLTKVLRRTIGLDELLVDEALDLALLDNEEAVPRLVLTDDHLAISGNQW